MDASVVVRWFVPEIHSNAARRLLTLPHEYVAPDLLFAEAANTVWKKVLRKELTAADGKRLVADFGRIAVETVPCRALAEDAHALAIATGRSVSDTTYVALAIRMDTHLLTADERLETALRNVPAVAGHIELVQSFEPEPAMDAESTTEAEPAMGPEPEDRDDQPV